MVHLDFADWARLSARVAGRDAEARRRLLAEIGLSDADLRVLDMMWEEQLARERAAGYPQRDDWYRMLIRREATLHAPPESGPPRAQTMDVDTLRARRAVLPFATEAPRSPAAPSGPRRTRSW